MPDTSSTGSTDQSLRSEIEWGVATAMFELFRGFEVRREGAAKNMKLHPTDFACIGYLDEATGPVSAKQIVSYLRLTSGSGTALLDRLEKSGLISRLPNPEDRRGVLVQLNRDAARDMLRHHRQNRQRFREAIEPFSDAELSTVVRFLGVINEAWKQGTEECPPQDPAK